MRKGSWQQRRHLLPEDPSPLRPSRPAASQSPGSGTAPPRSLGLPLRCGLRDRDGLFWRSRIRAERRGPRPARACNGLCKTTIWGWFTQVLY